MKKCYVTPEVTFFSISAEERFANTCSGISHTQGPMVGEYCDESVQDGLGEASCSWATTSQS